jgi:hypothetical protein
VYDAHVRKPKPQPRGGWGFGAYQRIELIYGLTLNLATNLRLKSRRRFANYAVRRDETIAERLTEHPSHNVGGSRVSVFKGGLEPPRVGYLPCSGRSCTHSSAQSLGLHMAFRPLCALV